MVGCEGCRATGWGCFLLLSDRELSELTKQFKLVSLTREVCITGLKISSLVSEGQMIVHYTGKESDN